jgi:hypothetical protein
VFYVLSVALVRIGLFFFEYILHYDVKYLDHTDVVFLLMGLRRV